MATKTYEEVVQEDAPRFLTLSDEASGSLIDDTRFGHDASVTGSPTFSVSGPSAQITGVTYDGSSNRHSTGQVTMYNDITYPFVMEAWIKTPTSPSVSTSYCTWCFSDDSGPSTRYYNLLYVDSDGSSNLTARLQVKDTSTASTLTSSITLAANTWYHLVAVLRSATDRELYVNGVSVGTDTTSKTSVTAASKNRIDLGSYSFNGGASTTYYAGTIACPAIYNYELSEERIRVHHAVGRGFTDDESYDYLILKAGAAYYLQTDETSGTTIADSSGFGNDATAAGSPTLAQTGPDGSTSNAISADGTDDEVNASGTALLDLVSGAFPFTYITWVKLPGSTSASTTYNRFGLFNDAATDEYFLVYTKTNAGNTRADVIEEGRNTTIQTSTYSDAMPLDEWAMIAVVCNSATDRETFLNGVSRGTGTGSVGIPTGLNSIALCTHDQSGGPSYGAGFHALQSVHPVAVSADDIRELHVAGRDLLDSQSEDGVARRDAPALRWKLEETSGSTAADDSPNGLDGTHSGSPTLSAGSVSYDGVNDKTEVMDSLVSDLGYPQTWVAVGKSPASTTSSTYYTILSAANSAASTDYSTLNFWTDGSNNLFVRFNLTISSSGDNVDTPAILTKNQSYMIHVVMASATDRRVYINGVQLGSSTVSKAIPSNFDNVTLGGIDISSPAFSQVTVEEAAIFGHELSEAEIRDQVSAWQGTFITYDTMAEQVQNHAPVVHLPLDETSGTTATDASPFGLDFTHSGSPTLAASGVTFDGVDDETTLSDSLVSDLGYPQTWMVVAKSPASTTSSTSYETMSASDSSASTDYFTLNFRTDGSNNLLLRFNTTVSSSGANADTSAILTKDHAYMVHVVMASATDRRVYVNGFQMASSTTSKAMPSTFDRVALGAVKLTPTSAFGNVTVEEAAIFGDELSEAEIRDQVAAWMGNTNKYGRKVHSFANTQYHRCNEGTGTTFADLSGFGRDATIVGSPTLTGAGPLYNETDDGAIGDGDGTDDAASATKPPVNTYPLAVSAWLKSTATPPASAGHGRVQLTNDGSNSDQMLVDFIADGSSNISMRMIFDDGTTSHVTSESNLREKEVFHHVVFVARSATDRELYVNSKSVATNTTSITWPSVDTTTILRSGDASPNYYKGSLSEISWHAYSLTDSDVLDLYLAAFEAQTTTLVPMGTINETGDVSVIVDPIVAAFKEETRTGHEVGVIIQPFHDVEFLKRQVVTIAASCSIIWDNAATTSLIRTRTGTTEVSIILDFEHEATYEYLATGDTSIIVDPEADATDETVVVTPATPILPGTKFTPWRQIYIFTPPREVGDNEV